MSIEPERERYQFIVEWYDKGADLTRRYQLFNYKKDNSIEMYDIKNQKIFLRRTVDKTFDLSRMFIGARVNVFSRLLQVVDFGDVFTKRALEQKKEKTCALVCPQNYLHLGKVISAIEENDFIISRMKMTRLSPQAANQLFSCPAQAAYMCTDLIVAMELVADDGIARWKDLIQQLPSLIGAACSPVAGVEECQLGCVGSKDVASSIRELAFFFGRECGLPQTAQLTNCTCVVIKPHLVKARQVGKVLQQILEEGFEVSALEQFRLEKAVAEEFFELYKDVMPEFNSMVEEMINGDCVVMEVRQDNVVPAFRRLAGPHDSQIAKTIRQNTIRARHGLDLVQNAVHCTDLPQDGPLECAYFFDLMAQGK